MEHGGLVVLTTISHSSIGHILRGYLESHGIPSFIFDEHPAKYGLGVQDLRLMVPAQHLEAAQKLLNECEAEGLSCAGM